MSYGSEEVLGPFLDSVPQTDAVDTIVVVVDNLAAPGGAVEELARRHGAIYLPQPENRGYGHGMNVGVAALPAEVKWVMISNPDVLFRSNTVGRLLAAANEDARIGAVGPAIVNLEDEIYPSARDIPSLRSGVGHALFANIWPNNPWSHRYRKSAETGRRREAGWLSGACLLVRRRAFDELHGFDSAYFMYFEDVDLGYRLGKAGWRRLYEPTATVMHSGAHSTRESSTAMISAHHESAYRFLASKYHGWYLWPLRLALRLALAVRSRFQRSRAR